MNFDRTLSIVGLIVGLFGTGFGIWAYVETRQLAQITYDISHETLFRPSTVIDTSLKLPSASNNINERVTQTVITLWNGGNVPFKGEDTRTKLTVSGDSSVSLLAHKVVLTKILPGSSGFSVSADEKSLQIDWRIFDPGEGIQIVLLSSGNAISIDVSGRFLPGQQIVRTPVRSILKSSAIFLIFLGGAFTLVLTAGLTARYSSKITSSRILNKIIALVVFLFVFVLYSYVSLRVVKSARLYAGDVSPLETDLIYIDVNKKLDYRYVPM